MSGSMPGGSFSPPPMIADLSVLLTPWGPLLARQWSRIAPFWLPRALVHFLEGDGPPLDTREDNALAPVVEAWNRCWPELVQSKGIFWFNDALDMSHAPKGEPPALLDRFDALAAALDRKTRPLMDGRESDLDRLYADGARDMLALAVTLRGETPVMLSAPRHGAAVPSACAALDRFGLSSHRLADEALREVLAGRLLHGFALAGLAPVLGGGVLRPAALQIATPSWALPLPPARPMAGTAFHGEPEDDALTSLFEDPIEDNLWDDAIAIWYELS